ncbi:hypothetical protein RND81_04G054000 [Saponaria officinalis]|uniref:UBA domain-containing protein n=1 Tax=Saponaria officinalis TaxID=3572 RepID=A0AAW1LCQ9_SAPOF
MNASKFMDKQIMDLSRSSMSDNNQDFIDLMNPQSEEGEDEQSNGGLSKKKQEILPNYDFHPINRPTFHSHHVNSTAATVTRDMPSLDNDSSARRSYSSLDHVEPDKIVMEKAQKANDNDSAILSEIDRTMIKHTDALMHAIGSLSARLSQIETRTRQIEHSVDDLKASVCNNHGTADGKLRQLENILLEVQTGVQDLKDKQDVFEGHMQLAKLQLSKSELPSSVHQDQAQQATATAAASAPPQQSGYQQFVIPIPQQLASVAPPSGPPPSQQNIHPQLPMTSQFLPATTLPSGPHQDAYLPTPAHIPDGSSHQYQTPPSVQNQQPAPPPPQPQQYQPAPAPPYPQPPQPPQQQHPSIVGVNAPPLFQPSGHRPDESPYAPPQTYPPNHYQPSSVPPPTQSYYGSPSLPMFEPPPPPQPARSSFQSSYVQQSGPSESFPYSGPTSHYGGGPSIKPQPHSPRGGTGSYPQLPTARVLPQAIPTASGVSGGSSTGGGNKVPIDDVVDKVTNMGFSRDQVRATVRRLTENGQSVDLNVVLDKLMNDADVQPPKGWFGR